MPKPSKMSKTKNNNKKTPKKKLSLGKKIGGGAKTAIQKRRARERALLKDY